MYSTGLIKNQDQERKLQGLPPIYATNACGKVINTKCGVKVCELKCDGTCKIKN